ncbi:MAG: hypothetical protein M3Q44_07280 [bacterium]|nr:hypothetical protein [bacterium]
MLKLGFLSFLLGFLFVGAACSTKPETGSPLPVATAAPSTQSMAIPEDSDASEDIPLSNDTDAESLQKDLDNTDVDSLNSAGSLLQSEVASP